MSERQKIKNVRYVRVGIRELREFRLTNQTARLVSWPYAQHDPLVFGFYVEVDE